MSEGITELGGDEAKREEEEEEESEEEEAINPSTLKPKTRNQKRDRRGRMFEEQKKIREKDENIRETEISRVKSIRKELNAAEKITEERQEKKKEA